MARPQRLNVDYFPFYCEEGKKMYYLEETYGNDGFATFIKILRELAKTNHHYLDLSKNTTMMFLSAKCKISKDILNSIIVDLVDLEKFDKVLWEDNKIIWCQDFVDSIQDAYIKRKNNCITYDSLLLLLCSLGIRKSIKSKVKGAGNTQTILKDTKVNKNKEDVETENTYHNIDILKSYYLTQTRIVKAVINNEKNKVKDLGDLKIKLDLYCKELTELGRLSETWLEFTSYFRNSLKIGKFDAKPDKPKTSKEHKPKIAF